MKSSKAETSVGKKMLGSIFRDIQFQALEEKTNSREESVLSKLKSRRNSLKSAATFGQMKHYLLPLNRLVSGPILSLLGTSAPSSNGDGSSGQTFDFKHKIPSSNPL